MWVMDHCVVIVLWVIMEQLWSKVCSCCWQEDSDLLGLRLFVEEQSCLLRDFSEQLEQSVSTLKQDVAAIVRRKRERSGTWS